MNENKPILFFDGECILCNKIVQWILRNEKASEILFCRLSSDYARKNIPDKYEREDSVILIKNNRVYIYFDAFIQIIPYLKWYWKFLYIIVLLPKSSRKVLYTYIAKNRKKWFGTTDRCLIANDKWKERLIE